MKSLISGEWRSKWLDQCLLTSNEKPSLTGADVISDFNREQEGIQCTEGTESFGTSLLPVWDMPHVCEQRHTAARPGVQPGPFCGGDVPELQEASGCTRAPRVFPVIPFTAQAADKRESTIGTVHVVSRNFVLLRKFLGSFS